jgi:hypothetical protein
MEDVSNLLVCAVLKSKVVDELLNAPILLFVGDGKLQARCERESLTDGEASKEDIFLLDVRSESGKGVFVHWDLVVEQDVSGDLCLIWDWNSVSQNIQERGFTGSGSSHNEGGLSGETDSSCVIDDQPARIV